MADETQKGGHWWGVVVALLLLREAAGRYGARESPPANGSQPSSDPDSPPQGWVLKWRQFRDDNTILLKMPSNHPGALPE